MIDFFSDDDVGVVNMYEHLFCPVCMCAVCPKTGSHDDCEAGNNSDWPDSYQRPVIESQICWNLIKQAGEEVAAAIRRLEGYKRRLAEIEAKEQAVFDELQERYDNMVKP